MIEQTEDATILEGMNEHEYSQMMAYARKISWCMGWNVLDHCPRVYYIAKKFGGGVIRTDSKRRRIELYLN